MKLSEFRPGLESWLQKYIIVNKWGVFRPEQGETVCFLPPTKELAYDTVATGTIQATATQEIFVRLRHDRNLTFEQLPIDTLQGYYQTLSMLLAERYGELGVNSLVVQPVASPLYIENAGENRTDWTIDLSWLVRCSFYAEAEPLLMNPTLDPESPGYAELYPVITVQSINTGLWRQPLDDNLSPVLDFRFTTVYPP
jgi:hypothetical protein